MQIFSQPLLYLLAEIKEQGRQLKKALLCQISYGQSFSNLVCQQLVKTLE